jgi:hypothetical protein
MSHATSIAPGGVVLDWRHAPTGPPEPCVFGDGLTICRSPVKDVPCHKGCAEAWITTHARNGTHLTALIRAYTHARLVRGGAR